MNFIEELYYGNIKPIEKRFERGTQYAKALELFSRNEDKLTKALSGNNLKLFNELVNAGNEIVACTGIESFKIGFILGVQMMVDCFKSDTHMVFKDI